MRLRKKKSLIDQAIDQASDVVDAALPVIESAMTTMRDQVREISKDAAEGAKDLAKDTRDKAGPLMADAKVLAGEIAEATREVAIPKAKAGALAGADRAVELAASGRDLAAAKLGDVKAEPQKPKGRLRKLLVFGSLAAAAGFAYNKMRPKPQADNWQSAYTPPTSTTSATGSSTGVTSGGTHLAPGVGPDEPVGADDPMVERVSDDPGGASPDEAVADAAEEPHEVTTPDEPAEVVEVAEAAEAVEAESTAKKKS